MINSINSYSNYNYYTNSLNSKNKQETKEEDIITTTNIHGHTFITGDAALPYRGKKFEYNTKIFGFDENVSEQEMKSFNAFMNKNKLKDPNKIEKSPLKNFGEESEKWDPIDEEIKSWMFLNYAQMYNLGHDIIKQASDLRDEYRELIRDQDLSLEEFKTKYMDFKKRHDEFVKEYEVAISDKMLLHDDIVTEQTNETNQTKTKPFKPIQAESKNKETYKAKDTNELIKKLLENKFDLAKELEILFNVKIDNDNTNNNSNTNNNNSNDNNSNSNHLSKLSSKAKTKHRSVNIKV
ncbi:hypothetical protein [Campylobacter aviculae]|uniref:Uncharacterized protein n=1 Tax=Campylobacter aviculae TaxID=2510190 RepID=A0A4V6YB47_9BACT|nr:hypothetical protein [Campylobacter aviculae]TKX32662.1 hypothetical protein CQA76_03290 [Campylobacter aviculae]